LTFSYLRIIISPWQRKRIGCPAVNHITNDIFDLLSHFKNICKFEFIFYTKIMAKSISTRTALISFNRITALICDRFVNAGEPAAVTVFPIKIKVVEEVRPEFAAAGSLRNLPPHSPISPFSYLPIFPASLFTPSALLNKINNRSLFKNTQKRYGRGDLAPTLTKIIKTPIVPNAPLVLTVKVGAGSPRPLQSFVTLKITNFALTDNLPGSRPLKNKGEQNETTTNNPTGT
jgi:hypothetical protein